MRRTTRPYVFRGVVPLIPEENQQVDLAILERIWRGEEGAKEDLVRKYQPMVHRLVRQRQNRWLEHEDLCQEGMLGLLRAAAEYAPERYAVKFSTFAYICIRRRISNVVKRSHTRKGVALAGAVSLNAQTGGENGVNLLDLLPAGVMDPVEIIQGRWGEERLRLVLRAHLSQVEFAVMELILQGLGAGEIQSELSLPAKVLDNARTRARLKLRRLLQQYGSLLSPGVPLSARRRLDLAMGVERRSRGVNAGEPGDTGFWQGYAEAGAE